MSSWTCTSKEEKKAYGFKSTKKNGKTILLYGNVSSTMVNLMMLYCAMNTITQQKQEHVACSLQDQQ
jgi:hypothetical protein